MPNNDDPSFFVELISKLDSSDCANIIIGGDFNLVMDQQLDSKGMSDNNNVNALEILKKYVETMELVYCWRIRNPDSKHFSWHRYHPRPKFSRLDMFLINVGYMSFVNNCSMTLGFKTDHSFVEMDLVFEEIVRGRGLWKLNSAHIEREDFVEIIYNTVEKSLAKTNYCKPDVIWEILKCDITESAINYAKKQKSQLHELLDRVNFNVKLRSFHIIWMKSYLTMTQSKVK